jgi:multiple sugar transport system ATP-binding protein
MRTEIKELHQRLKTTTVYVTHDQIEAMTMADKIVVMHDGIVEQIGAPLTLYDDPANLFVAGFIGSPQMNFIPAEKLGEMGCKTLGIRPEHIALSREAGEWKGKVVHAEHLGADTILYLETEAAGLVTVRLFGEHRYSADDVVFATPDKASIHRFDGNDQAIR